MYHEFPIYNWFNYEEQEMTKAIVSENRHIPIWRNAKGIDFIRISAFKCRGHQL